MKAVQLSELEKRCGTAVAKIMESSGLLCSLCESAFFILAEDALGHHVVERLLAFVRMQMNFMPRASSMPQSSSASLRQDTKRHCSAGRKLIDKRFAARKPELVVLVRAGAEGT